MIKSMTGYGAAQHEDEQRIIYVEVKCLNSKYLDASPKLPKLFSDKEHEVRNLLSERLVRGKAAVLLEYQRKELAEPKVTINEGLFKAYHSQLAGLAEAVGAPTNSPEMFKLALQSPEVMITKKDDADLSEEWEILRKTLGAAIDQVDQFRVQEGQALKQKFEGYIAKITELLAGVDELEPRRAEAVRERLKGNLEQLLSDEQYDKSRFEQELIYYLEKLDITEERVRLRNHLKYFLENLAKGEAHGKRLNFIAQEMGREINTLGAKANDADIQKLVVQMKEELEKIKEQVLNIL